MAVLDFVTRRFFVKNYLLTTIVLLSLTLVVNFLGFLGNPAIQAMAGALNLVGITLMGGAILLTLNLVNRSTRIGKILIRFSYVIFAVVSLCLSLIALTTVISSILANSTLAMQMSVSAFTTQLTLSITVITLSYFTLPIEGVWALNQSR